MKSANGERPGVSASLVLGACAVLLLAGVLVLTLVTQRTGSVDASERLAAWFDARELPAGLALAGAEVLPRGDVALRIELSPAPEEAPRVVMTEEQPPEGQREPFDWSKVPVGEPDTLPREVLVVELPLQYAAGELRGLFEEGQELRGDFKSIERSGGQRVLERGKLPWGSFAAPFAVVREFEAGGTFHDTLRVNLSREKSPRILLARWSRGLPASKKRAEELLAALRPKS